MALAKQVVTGAVVKAAKIKGTVAKQLVRHAATGTFKSWGSAIAKSNAGSRIEIVRKGVEPRVIVLASDYFNMPRNSFAKLIGMSPATADRKIRNGTLLGMSESERLERIALIEDEAEKVFGSANLAKEWLTRNNAALGDSPLSMLDTETGAGEVRKILSGIAYGGAV